MAIFECVVVDNSCFWKNGRIKIRLCNSTNTGDGFEDFSISPEASRNYGRNNFGGSEDENVTGEGVIITDKFAELSTCIGGAYDSGMFYLPQPNTHGIVGTIECKSSNYTRYVWLGALANFSPSLNSELVKHDEQDVINEEEPTVTDINIPSDDLDNKNGFNDGNTRFVKEENKNHAIIFKQKETYWSKDDSGNTTDKIDDYSKDTLDWKKVNTLNMAVIDKSRTMIIHNMYDKNDNYIGQAHIKIDNDTGISLKFDKTENDKVYQSSVEVTTDGVARLSSNFNNEISNIFEATTEELTISHNEGNNVSCAITMGSSAPGLGSDSDRQMNIVLKQGDDKEEFSLLKGGINISSNGVINLNPGKNGHINIAGSSGDHYLLAYPSAGIADSGAISNFEAGSIIACAKIHV